MGQAPKGIFDELIEGLAKDFEMKSIVEASRDDSGKIDVGMATGIAMGLGYTSLDDTARFGAILGASGGFDDDNSFADDDFSDDDDSFPDDDFDDDFSD